MISGMFKLEKKQAKELLDQVELKDGVVKDYVVATIKSMARIGDHDPDIIASAMASRTMSKALKELDRLNVFRVATKL